MRRSSHHASLYRRGGDEPTAIALTELELSGDASRHPGRKDTSTNKTWVKRLAAVVLSALASMALFQRFVGRSGGGRPASTEEPQLDSPLQGPRPPPEGEGYGCQDSDQECWAGVYFDSATKEVLHLEAGGQAFLSPGTAAPAAPNARGGCFWWKAEQAELHLVGCLDQRPFTWPGAGGNLRRDPPQAGKMVGFGAEWRTGDDDEAPEEASESPGNPSRVDGMVVRVARDPLGFLFPGSMYEMLLRPGAGCGTRYSRRYRGVLNRDGTVTDGASGRRVATWSFPETRVLPGGGGGSWATGDAIVLRVETDHYQSQHAATNADREDHGNELSTSDGGRTWLPTTGNGQTGQGIVPESLVASANKGTGCATLSLLLPEDVSMLPVSAAVLSAATHLDANEPPGFVPEEERIATDGKKPEPVVQVFEAQPYCLSGQDCGDTEELAAVIVISRELPRPHESKEDFSCVMNDASVRAVWLSWSMVLCSTKYVKPDEVTLYLAYQGKRVTVDFSFLHTPPPRHTRLAWPATETFDLPLSGLVPAMAKVPQGVDADDAPLGSSGNPLGTTVALCTMFKNEAPYLEEWLQYHRLLGVSKVYMYDNFSSDQSRDFIRKHELSGFVQVRDWRHHGAQTEALNDCLCRFRHAARWVSFVDVDEFIDPAPSLPVPGVAELSQARVRQAGSDAVVDDDGSMTARRRLLRSFFKGPASERHTHCMPWVNYCAHGQLSRRPGGILENFLQVEDMGEREIHMQKPLFKALEALTLRMVGPHFFIYAAEDVEEQYKRRLSCAYEWMDKSEFRLRHYRSKSLEEYVQRRVGEDSAYRNRRYTKDKLTSEWHETNEQCGKGEEAPENRS